MFEHLRAHLARPTFFLAAGIAIGALLAPTFDGGGAQAVTTYTRTNSCGALGGFQPINSATGYAHYLNGTRLYWTGGGTGFFLCNPGLPNKAVVTRVRFTIYDYSAGGEVRNCALVRSGLTPPTAESLQVLASVPATGVSPYSDQPLRPSDTSISYAAIDNANFAYFLQCELSASSSAVGLYGADVTYKITAANG
jgi:hypothetical protein